MKKANPSTPGYCYARYLLLLLLIGVSLSQVSAQCTGCTSTISANTANITVNSGNVVCITYAGTFNKTITMNGGTLCISAATTVSSAITMPSGSAVNIYGKYTGSMSQSGGAITVYSGGSFGPSGFTVNGGSLTINAGGTGTLGTPTFPNGYVFNDYGALTISGFTLNSGATVNLAGTPLSITGGVSNNGTLSITGPATINGSFSQNGGTMTTFSGGITVTGSVSNNGTINLAGAFTAGGGYTSNSGATIKATTSASGCNAVSFGGTISGSGTFDGGGYGMTVSPAPSCCMTGGATGPLTAPTQQPTNPNGSLSGNTVSGSFTSPSASISGYIVLRTVGAAVPTCNPVNNTAYTVGNTVGGCTVAAMIPGGTGTKSFTDVIPASASNCGSNINYRIFAYNGSGACTMFNTTNPMTGSMPIPAFSTSVTSGGATTFCAPGSVTLTGTGGLSYIWSTGANTEAISATTTNTYTVTATNSMGCTATASQAVTANAAPDAVITAGGPTSLCTGGSVTLTGSGGGTYAWSTGATTAAITATTAGTYILTVTKNGCTDTAISVVSVTGPPTAAIAASGPTAFCAGGSVTLTASGGGTYLWSNSTNSTTAAISVTTGGTYRVTVTGASSCTATASQVVTVNANPTATIASSGATALCTGGSVTLTASGGGTYVWSNSAASTTAAISVTTAGTYRVTVTSTSSCTATASQAVTINASPTATITASGPTAFCPGGSVTLTASGGTGYVWSNPAGSTTAAISVSTAGTYTVTVTNAASCTATASRAVTINAVPVAAIAVTGGCAGDSSTLTASGGSTYLWSTGANTASITSPTAASYAVTVTNGAGCTASASATAIIYTKPTLSISSNSPACVGTSILLSATPAGSTSYTYSWTGPVSYTSATQSPTVANVTSANAGTYALTVTDNNNCTVNGSIAVAVDANCIDSTTTGANGGGSSDAPCTQILRFDHYNDVVAGAGGQNHTWILNNGNRLSMTITRIAGGFTAVAAPTWSGAAFGQSGYTGLLGKTVLYSSNSGWSKVQFSNIQMKDSNGALINNFTLIGIDAESTDNAERDTLVSNGTTWYDYDTITPPNIGSVPAESGIGTSTLIWTGTGGANARSRLVSTNNPTNFSFSTIAGGLQGFAMGISNPVAAPSAVTICSNSAFSAAATNLPVGTTYTWTAPVISPAGSITGATAQATPTSVVGQTLVNTTSANATATYTVVPSNNCSGLGYTVVVTVKPAPAVTITNTGPVCSGGNITVTATPTAGTPLTYSWSGPSSFTSTANTFTITGGTAAQSGTYSVTITGSNTCTATATSTVTFASCVSVSGSVFNDANGNGLVNATDTISSRGQTLYAILSDTNNLVLTSSAVAATGAFTLSNILPSTSGMTLRISTANPTAGTSVSAASWPANWLGTLGQYGVNNAAGTGIYNNTNQLIPVRTGTQNITGIYIGYDRLSVPVSQSYTIAYPMHNTIKALTTAAGLGNVTWVDPEDGANLGSFVVAGVTAMRGNTLFYDSNANNLAETSEVINGYRVIGNFSNAKLKVKFTGVGSTGLMFSFAYMDAAGKTNPASSTYTVNWTGGALPVKLEYFTAEKKDEHSALLKWSTASEINNDHFDVERSADAQSWSKIGEVHGAGNSNETVNYSLVDEQPLSGANYYRLKQVDIDGQSEYSDIAEVEFGAAEHSTTVMTIYPNPLPVNHALNIALAGTADAIKLITITNAIGQQVYKYEPSNEQGYKVSGLNLAMGTYIVNVVSQSNESFSSKIVIQ